MFSDRRETRHESCLPVKVKGNHTMADADEASERLAAMLAAAPAPGSGMYRRNRPGQTTAPAPVPVPPPADTPKPVADIDEAVAIMRRQDAEALKRKEEQNRNFHADGTSRTPAPVADEDDADDAPEALEETEASWQSGTYYHGFPIGSWLERYEKQYEWKRLAAVRGIPDLTAAAYWQLCEELPKQLAAGKITIRDLLDWRFCGGPVLPTGFVYGTDDVEGLDIHVRRTEYDKQAQARLAAAERERALDPTVPFRNIRIAREELEKTAEVIFAKVCPVFHIAARTIDRTSGEASGYLLHFEVDDQPRALVLLDETLETGSCFRKLADAGFIVEKTKRSNFIRIVRATETCARVHVESVPGWYDCTFLAATGEAITGPDTDDCSDPERLARGPIGHALHPDVACDAGKGGNLEAWRANVVDPSWVSGQTPQFALAPILGLAGVTLQLADAENFVAYPFGRTTGGKSTQQTIAAGTVANPAHGKGTLVDASDNDPVIRRANTAGRGTSWHIDGKDGSNATRTVATIREGSVGNGGTILTISSERGPLELAKAAGTDLDAGVLVRLLPIDLGVETPRYRINPSTADAIKAAARTHYGHALAPLVQQVLAEGLHKGDGLRGEVADRADKLLAGSTDAELHRAAQHVGVLWVTGELMLDAGLLPADADVPALMTWLWEGYLAFRRQWQAGTASSARKVRELLQAFAAGPHVRQLDAAEGLGRFWGWRDGHTLYVRADKLPAVLGRVLGARRAMRKALGDMLMLPGDATNTLTFRKVPGVGYVRHYRLSLD